MSTGMLFLLVIAFAAGAHYLGYSRSMALGRPLGGSKYLASLPSYYGLYVALASLLPALLLLLLWSLLEDRLLQRLVVQSLPAASQALDAQALGLLQDAIRSLANSNRGVAGGSEVEQAAFYLQELRHSSASYRVIATLLVALAGLLYGWSRVSPRFIARLAVERVYHVLLLACALLAILTTAGILLSVLFESLLFFNQVAITEFLFGLEWSPQIALRADQQGASGSFGAVPLFAGTLLIALIAMLVAVPVGLMSAIYLAEYAAPQVRARVKPVLEILAGIPTVVYGFFAALTVAPLIRGWGQSLGLDVSSESALAAGLVMGIMIIPFVSSLSDDILHAVPQSMRDGSLGMGATRSETVKRVVIPAALPGIVAGILLAVSRAIGETMIVVMAAGLSAKLTANPMESVTTVTVQIVTLLVGDQEFDSAKTLAAFALGLILFLVTLVLNFIALHVVKKYREQYE